MRKPHLHRRITFEHKLDHAYDIGLSDNPEFYVYFLEDVLRRITHWKGHVLDRNILVCYLPFTVVVQFGGVDR